MLGNTKRKQFLKRSRDFELSSLVNEGSPNFSLSSCSSNLDYNERKKLDYCKEVKFHTRKQLLKKLIRF